MNAPVSHLQEAQKLTADATVDLFQLKLRTSDTYFRFKDGQTKTWQGHTYEGMAVRLTGDSRSADSEESRPQLQIMNPLGVFNLPAKQGLLDRALITRKRLLLTDLDANANIYDQRMWYVGRVPNLLSGQAISLELRNMTEGPQFQIPVRIYMPPEFPTVSI